MLNRVTKSVKNISYERWVGAFLVFAAIYAEHFPNSSSHSFKYMPTIQELYKTYGIDAAIKCDQNFRCLKEQSPIEECKWNSLNQELYLMAAARAVQQNANPRKKVNFRPQNARISPPLQLFRNTEVLC